MTVITSHLPQPLLGITYTVGSGEGRHGYLQVRFMLVVAEQNDGATVLQTLIEAPMIS
jgi:hypothetical protein